jgi:hypothetical protein
MTHDEQDSEGYGSPDSDELPDQSSIAISGRGHDPVGESAEHKADRHAENVPDVSERTSRSELPTPDPLFDEESELPPTRKNSDGLLAQVLNDLGLSPDLDWADLNAVVIKVLGAVEVEGWRSPPARAIVTELACYLALHRERALSGEQLRLALRPDEGREPTAKTMRTYLSMLRKALGPGYLPSNRSGGYRFSILVTSDWEGFKQLSGRENDLETRLSALTLIRGRPFEAVPSGTYDWVFSEFWISQIETAVISVACELGSDCLEQRLLDKADRAVRHGLLAVPHDQSLWHLRLQIAAERGPTFLKAVTAEAAATLESGVLSDLIEEMNL